MENDIISDGEQVEFNDPIYGKGKGEIVGYWECPILGTLYVIKPKRKLKKEIAKYRTIHVQKKFIVVTPF